MPTEDQGKGKLSDGIASTEAETADAIRPRTITEAAVIGVALILLLVLGYSVQPIVSPFLLIGAMIYLLYPLRKRTLPSRILWLSVIVFLCWFIYSILHLLAPFIFAFLVAYLLNPLVTRMQQRGIARWVSSLTISILLVALVAGFFLFVMPLVVQQFQGILAGLNTIVNEFSELLKSGTIFEVLARYGLPVDKAREMISEQVSPRLENLLTHLFEGVFRFVTGVSSLLLQLINVVIIPFLLFYILKDFPLIRHRFAFLFPEERRTHVLELLDKVDDLLGRYIRGAIMVAIIQGTIAAAGLWIIGVKYSLVLGIMVGVLDFIPYIGLITGVIVSSIVALFSGEAVLVKVFAVIILFLSQKVLEASVLAPKIIGTQVGVHPVLLILCLLIFGYFLGFVGLLIAVPATALILAALNEWERTRDEAQHAAETQAT